MPIIFPVFWPFTVACEWLKNAFQLSPTTIKFTMRIGLLQLTITWYKNPPCWRASSLLFPHWDVKTKASQASLVQVSLCENNNELALQHGGFLYHVIVSCKRPMTVKRGRMGRNNYLPAHTRGLLPCEGNYECVPEIRKIQMVITRSSTQVLVCNTPIEFIK